MERNKGGAACASLVIAWLGLGLTPAAAQVLRCNMTAPCGAAPAPPCAGGCAAPSAVIHASAFPCSPGAGSFNLTGTQYENTCSLGNGCTVNQPHMRFWQHDNYALANNGCQPQDQTQLGIEWVVNSYLDDATGPPAHWYLWQPGWSGPQIDGCYDVVEPQVQHRTVAEISAVDSRPEHEGSINHHAWFLIASVPRGPFGFNFDTVTGASGCNTGDVPQQPVGGVRISGRQETCAGSGVATQATQPDCHPGFFDVAIELVEPNPHWWNESGQDAPPALIDGFQILYATGPEPTSSDFASGGWHPVYDPADCSAPKNALGVVPRGTSGSFTVALPETSPGTDYWLAARIVYHDSTENPTAPFDPASGTPSAPVGPQVTTPVSQHCGPLYFGARLNQVRGLVVTQAGDDMLLEWTPLAGAASYNVWKVASADDIDLARITSVPPAVGVAGCSWPNPTSAHTCIDLGGALGGPAFYQVRTAIDAASEGP